MPTLLNTLGIPQPDSQATGGEDILRQLLNQQVSASPQLPEAVQPEPVGFGQVFSLALADALKNYGEAQLGRSSPGALDQLRSRREQRAQQETQRRTQQSLLDTESKSRQAELQLGQLDTRQQRRQNLADEARGVAREDKLNAEKQIQRQAEIRADYINSFARDGLLGGLGGKELENMNIEDIQSLANREFQKRYEREFNTKLGQGEMTQDQSAAGGFFSDFVLGGNGMPPLADRVASGQNEDQIVDEFMLRLMSLPALPPTYRKTLELDLRDRIRAMGTTTDTGPTVSTGESAAKAIQGIGQPGVPTMGGFGLAEPVTRNLFDFFRTLTGNQ